MKKLFFLLLLALGLPVASFGQAVTITTGYIASATGTSSGLATPTTYYHQISWSVISGTPATCVVKVDSSTDNVSFSAGGVIDSQGCTNGGMSPVVNVQSNYIRINVSTFTGNAVIKIVYVGFSSSGGGNGSVTASATLTSGQVLVGGGTTVVSPAGTALTYSAPALSIGVAGSSGVLKLLGTTSGTVSQTVQDVAGTPTVTWGTATGTPAVTASAPLGITTATGNITCSTCLVTNGALGTATATSIAIGGGTPITKVLTATATLDFGNLAALGCEDLTVTVTGAADGDTAWAAALNASYVSATSFYTAFVSATDTVTIRYCALVSGNPASATYRATVLHF